MLTPLVTRLSLPHSYLQDFTDLLLALLLCLLGETFKIGLFLRESGHVFVLFLCNLLLHLGQKNFLSFLQKQVQFSEFSQ